MKSQIFILMAVLASAFSSWPRAATKPKPTSIKRQKEPKTVVVGGGGSDMEEPLHPFPYQVAIKCYETSRSYWCKGALITDTWVLTTAWVAKQIGPKPFAVLGAHYPNATEYLQQRIEIDKKIIHEGYEYPCTNDIALHRLKEEAQLNKYVATIMVAPLNSRTFEGELLVMMEAWQHGCKEANLDPGPLSDTVRPVKANAISNTDCQKAFGSHITSGSMCVHIMEKKGPCSYDNGAPLVNEEIGILVGLASEFGACNDDKKPNILTRISYFNRWIVNNAE